MGYKINKYYSRFLFHCKQVSQASQDAAVALSAPYLSSVDSVKAEKAALNRKEENQRLYNELIADLLALVNSEKM